MFHRRTIEELDQEKNEIIVTKVATLPDGGLMTQTQRRKNLEGQQDAWFHLDLPDCDIYNKNRTCGFLSTSRRYTVNKSRLVNQLARSSS